MGVMPVGKLIANMALPMVISMLVQALYNVVDSIYVSQVSESAVTALSLAFPIQNLLIGFAVGIGVGVNSLLSKSLGEKNQEAANRAAGNGIVLMAIAMVLFVLFGLFGVRPYFAIQSDNPETVEGGIVYTSICCVFSVGCFASILGERLLQSTGRTVHTMITQSIGAIINIILDPILIHGWFGLPAMGIAGAALATCISSWLGPVLILLFSLFEKNLLIGPIRELTAFGLKNLGAFYRRAMPVVFNEGMWALGILIVNMIYSNIGYEYYAGMTIFKTFADLAFAFYVGLGNSCVIMVGKSIGSGKIRRGVEDARRFSVLIPLLGMVIGGLVILFRYPLISIFSSGSNLSQLTLDTALAVTVFCSLEVWFRNISYVQVVGVFRSGGDTLCGMLYDMGSLWLVSIPLTYLAANVLKLPFVGVVMVAYLAEDIPKSIACLIHFKSMKWLKPVTDEGREGLRAYRDSE